MQWSILPINLIWKIILELNITNNAVSHIQERPLLMFTRALCGFNNACQI